MLLSQMACRQNFEKNLVRGKIKKVIPNEIKINKFSQPEIVK